METNVLPLEVKSSRSELEVAGREVKTAPQPPTEAELLAKLTECGDAMRELILLTKRLPRIAGLEAHQEQGRSLALAQAHLQTGFMWLRRAISPSKDF